MGWGAALCWVKLNPVNWRASLTGVGKPFVKEKQIAEMVDVSMSLQALMAGLVVF